MHSRSLCSLQVIACVSGLVAASACSSMPGLSSEGVHDRYAGESWSVVVRAGETPIDEVEIRGLIPRRVITASGSAIQQQSDGSFEIDVMKVASSLADEGEAELAGTLRRRGIRRIVLDWVGDVALRVRLDNDPESALVLNRERGQDEQGSRRLPAGSPSSSTDLLPFDRFSPTRY